MARNKNTIIFTILGIFTLFFLSTQTVLGVCPISCGGPPPDCTIPACRNNFDCGCSSGAGEKSLGIFKGFGPLSDFIDSITRTNPDPAISTFSNFISTIVGILTVVAFIWFIFNLFIGAIAWLSSGGDKAKLQEAQKKITTNLVGLVIVVSAIFLTKIIGVVFGIDILAIQNLIKNLQ